VGHLGQRSNVFLTRHITASFARLRQQADRRGDRSAESASDHADHNSTDLNWFRKAAEASNAICIHQWPASPYDARPAARSRRHKGGVFYFAQRQTVCRVFCKIGFGVTTVWKYQENS